MSLLLAALLPGAVQAGNPRHGATPLFIKGYQTYTNLAFVNPDNPTVLEVRTGGEGGVSHLGKMRSWSADQQGNLVTGELTGSYIFQDQNGDQLLLSAAGTNAMQPDGRVTFEGDYTVTGGTGRFKHATGKLHFEGWARTTDFTTGTGIGFGTIEGFIRGTRIDADPSFVAVDRGNATFDGADFEYLGTGVATRIGRFDSSVRNVPGPFNGAFVGIVDGQFTLAWAFETVWTRRNGEKIRWSGVQFVYFELLTLPDGSLAPDFTKPSTSDLYHTLEGGTGRYAHAQGVTFDRGTFIPTGPTSIAAQINSKGFISQYGND
jgi:hypothetical protein